MAIAASAWAGMPIYQIDSSGGYLAPGEPQSPFRVLAIAGKPMEVRWQADGESALKIERITDTRRVAVAEGAATRAGDMWTWAWEPPKTRGVVTYELTQAGAASPIIQMEIRSATWLTDGMAVLNSAKWQVSGLRPEERAALADLGLRLVPERASRSDPAVVTMISGAGEKGARRDVVLMDGEVATVIWRPGAVSGDWRVAVPRWWFSRESLATDEGKIRLLDLFIEPPENF